MRSLSIPGWLCRAAVVAAAAGAIAAFAAHETDPAAAAEGLYLAKWTAGALGAVALLAAGAHGRPRGLGAGAGFPADCTLGLGAALAVTAAWALPAGPSRGATVLLILTACLGLAAARRLAGESGDGGVARRGAGAARDDGAGRETRAERHVEPACDQAVGYGGRDGQSGKDGSSAAAGHGFRCQAGAVWRSCFAGWCSDLPAACGLCLGSQVLLRGDLLSAAGGAAGVAAQARPWVALVALPVAAGAALALLWRRYGALPAMAAGASAALVAPGWTVGTTLALIALAGGSELARGSAAEGAPPAAIQGDKRRLPAGAIWSKAASVVALLVPVAWQPRSGWSAALAGLAVAYPRLALGAAVPLAVLCRFVPLPGALAAHTGWREGAFGVSWVLLLVPAATLTLCGLAGGEPAAEISHATPLGFLRQAAAVARRLVTRRRLAARRRCTAAAALLIAFATPWVPDRSALAGAVALAALSLPASGVAAGVAAAWSAMLAGATALLAAYPWLRRDPLAGAVALAGGGFSAGPRLAAAVAGAALALGGALTLALRRREPAVSAPAAGSARPMRLGAAMTAAAVLAAMLIPLLVHPELALMVAGQTVLLDRQHPSWAGEVSPRRTAMVAVQSDLINAAGLANGTPVARIQLLASGSDTQDLQLLAGRDTGEWSARRADVAAAARLHSPAPWVSWIAGPFLGQRYRCRLAVPHGGSFARIRIDLAPGLPANTGLALHQVEVAP